jgi:hypothetical protein
VNIFFELCNFNNKMLFYFAIILEFIGG